VFSQLVFLKTLRTFKHHRIGSVKYCAQKTYSKWSVFGLNSRKNISLKLVQQFNRNKRILKNLDWKVFHNFYLFTYLINVMLKHVIFSRYAGSSLESNPATPNNGYGMGYETPPMHRMPMAQWVPGSTFCSTVINISPSGILRQIQSASQNWASLP